MASKGSKKVKATLKLLINAGQAKPAPPVGPALGQAGLNIMSFCKDFNAKTADVKPDVPIPVVITAYEDKTYEYITKTPPTSYFVKRALGLESGSQQPGHKKYGSRSRERKLTLTSHVLCIHKDMWHLVNARHHMIVSSNLKSVYIKGDMACRGRHPAGKGMTRMSSKWGNKSYYKGNRVKSTGVHTRLGGFKILKARLPNYIIPDLSNFKLKPYVAYRSGPASTKGTNSNSRQLPSA